MKRKVVRHKKQENHYHEPYIFDIQNIKNSRNLNSIIILIIGCSSCAFSQIISTGMEFSIPLLNLVYQQQKRLERIEKQLNLNSSLKK